MRCWIDADVLWLTRGKTYEMCPLPLHPLPLLLGCVAAKRDIGYYTSESQLCVTENNLTQGGNPHDTAPASKQFFTPRRI